MSGGNFSKEEFQCSGFWSTIPSLCVPSTRRTMRYKFLHTLSLATGKVRSSLGLRIQSFAAVRGFGINYMV